MAMISVLLAAAAFGAAGFGAAKAQESNLPIDGGVTMLPAASELAEEMHFFHNIVLMPIVTVISLFVLALLLWVMFRYNSKNNPVPHKFSHNLTVEIAWTVLPIIILLFISVFSYDLLFKEDIIPDGRQIVAEADGATDVFAFDNDFPKSRMAASGRHVQVFLGSSSGVAGLAPGKDYTLEGLGTPTVSVKLKETPPAGDRILVRLGRSLVGAGDDKEIALAPTMTLKVTGYQWGWTYSYPDFGDFEFTANMVPKSEAPPELYRFAVDNYVVVPVGETVRVIVTGREVIHSWALPNFGIKIDAVPGRLNETWFKADRPGRYYGQCSEICGVRHSAMPIGVEAVSRADFENWVNQRRAEAGMEPMFGAIASAETRSTFAAAAAGDTQ